MSEILIKPFVYDTKLECTYHGEDIFGEDKDNLTEEEKGFIRDVIYRQEFLNIFGLQEFDDEKPFAAIVALVDKVSFHDGLRECMLQVSGQYMSTDVDFGLMILYSCDYMYLMHACVADLLERGDISAEKLEKLRAKLF